MPPPTLPTHPPPTPHCTCVASPHSVRALRACACAALRGLLQVQVTNTSVLVRFGDAASRPPPNAYLNPIERYRLQLEDLDTHLNSTLVTLPPYDAGGAPSAAYGTSGALFVGPAADAPATLSVTFDLSAVSNVPLEPADDYRIRVQAANSEGWGPYSTWLHIHTVHRPEAPSGLSLIAKSGRSIQVRR